MIPFLPNVLDEDGVVTFVYEGAVSWVGAQGYTDSAPVGIEAEADAADVFSGGVRYTADGAVRLYDATAGLPEGSGVSGGFAITSDGLLCVTSDSPDSDSVRIGGVAVTQDGRVHAVWGTP